MATVYKKPNSKYWYAQYYDSTGKRVAKSTGKEKKRDAEKVAADLESEDRKRAEKSDFGKPFAVILESAARDAGAGSLTLARASELLERMKRAANPDFKETTLRDAWNQWKAIQAEHISESTAKGYSEDMEIFVGTISAQVVDGPLSELRDSHIRSAALKAAKAGRKAATVNKALASLRRTLEWAVSQKMIETNPAKQVRALPEDDSIERAPFTVAEVRLLIDAAASGGWVGPVVAKKVSAELFDEWAGAITIAPQTGLRMGDIVELSDKHVAGTRFEIRPSKTKRRKKHVSIPLSPPVIGWIGDRKGPFFPHLSKLSKPERSMHFAAIMKKAGVPKKVVAPGGVEMSRSFHSLRHTFASWLAEADVHADVRQKLTGHSSSKMHQRYTHHDEALDRAVGTLPSL